MRHGAHLWRPLAFGLVLMLFLPWPTGPAWGQDPSRGEYLKQLQRQQQGNWLKRELRRFRSYARMDRVHRLMEAGQFPAARKELENYLGTDPQDSEARYTYLLLLFKMKDYGETIHQADLILTKHPQFVPALLYRGLAHQALAHPDEAQADFQAAATQADTTPLDRRFALNMLVDLALQQKNYAMALNRLEILEKSEKDFKSTYRRGLALEGLGRLADAEPAYRLALDQARSAAERVMAYRALGELASKQRDWTAASRAFQAALDLEPDNPEVLRTLAEAAYAQKDYNASAKFIQRSLALRPSSQDREFLINVLGFLRDYQEVTGQLIRLLDEAKNPEERYRIYSALGNTYSKWGKFGEAAGAFQEAARLKEDAATLEALAQAREREGRPGQAIALYRQILQRQPTPEVHLKLGLLLDKTGDRRGAVSHLEPAAASRLPGKQRGMAYKQLGAIYYQLERYPEAQRSLEKALVLQPHDPHIYQALAENALKLQDPEQALAYQKKALELTHRAETAGPMWETLGFIALKLDRHQEAADYFHQALAAGRDRWEIRQELGVALFKVKKWPEALQQFKMALDFRRAPQTLIYLGLTYQKLRKPGLAIHYLTGAQAAGDRLEPTERRDLYNALGYLYAEENEYAQAVKAWSQSLALKADPVIALALAKMQQRLGESQEALGTLEAIDPAALTPAKQAERLDETATALKANQHPEKALEALTQAAQIESTAVRDYRIGLLYQEGRKIREAIPYLEKAIGSDPENNQYKVALGYAYLDRKEYRQAASLFEEVLRRDPDFLKLYEDLGYIHMHALHNDRAVEWFKRAIDNQSLYPVRTPEEAEQLRQDLYRYRKEVSKITNRYDFTTYLSFQTAKPSQSVAPAAVGGGALPSQGGVEFAYQPPELGFRDERIFQVFTRILWTIQPGSMRFNEDSFQGGVGLRYKPLQTQNLYLWGERLFKIGDKALDDWLLRLLYSWNYGYDLQPGKSWWNYTFLYGDLAYFTKAPGTWASYGEIRQGVTFNFNDNVLLTPHLVVDARSQDPHPINSSYLEAGAGVSLKFLFLETRYEVHRASFEILAYFKHGNFLNRTFKISGDKYDGFFLTGIFHF